MVVVVGFQASTLPTAIGDRPNRLVCAIDDAYLTIIFGHFPSPAVIGSGAYAPLEQTLSIPDRPLETDPIYPRAPSRNGPDLSAIALAKQTRAIRDRLFGTDPIYPRTPYRNGPALSAIAI